MGNSDLFLERLVKKHGLDSEFAKLHQKNQRALKLANKGQIRLVCVMILSIILGMILVHLFDSIFFGFVTVIIIVAYMAWDNFQFQKELDEIYKD